MTSHMFLANWCCFTWGFSQHHRFRVRTCVLSHFSHVCDPMDYSLPGSSVYGILQARILECLLQGIFLTQGLNPWLLCLLHWQAGSLPLAPLGSSRLRVVRLISWLLLPLEHKRHFQAFFRVDWSNVILSSSTSPLDHCLSYLLCL